MSANDMATKPPQALPSFQQAFGDTPSLIRSSPDTNALPPLYPHPSPYEHHRQSPAARQSPQIPADPSRRSSKKRTHAETSSAPRNEESSGSDERRSPRIVRIKEENDYDNIPSISQSRPREHIFGAPAPSTTLPSSAKRRRVTISGISHPIDTDARAPASDNAISPVFMGFTLKRDNPHALEQVRSTINIKQEQKAIIEQRRGSTASIVSSTTPPIVNVVNPPHPPHSDDRQGPSKPSVSSRAGGRSPNMSSSAAAARRSTITLAAAPSQSRQPSPGHLSAASHAPPPPPPPPSEPKPHLHAPPLANALPAPPISFAHRRANRQLGGAKGKPADIVISPRDTEGGGALHPVVQSAPPIPRAGQQPGWFPGMTLPSLPPVMRTAQGPPRLTASRVPPTPTRLGTARHGASSSSGGPTVPIATTLVPPTPAALHHPGYTGEKSAFLAPFEMFYDALADSRQLKGWLAEQLQKAQTLSAALQRQQDGLDDAVGAIVERRFAAMRDEVHGLRRRVEELEHELRAARAPHVRAPMKGREPKAHSNGTYGAAAPDAYTFPPVPVDASVRRPEPVRPAQLERDGESRSFPGSQVGSPVPFDSGRRLSVSAIRLDPPRQPPAASERHREREGPGQGQGQVQAQSRGLQGPGKAGWSPLGAKATTRSTLGQVQAAERPGPTRRLSAGRVPMEKYQGRNGGPALSDQTVDGRPEGPFAVQGKDVVAASSPRDRAPSPMDDG